MGLVIHAVKKSGYNVCNGGLAGHSIGQCFGTYVKMSMAGPEHKHVKVTCKACIAKKAKKKGKK
jgi:hypothetical protein